MNVKKSLVLAITMGFFSLALGTSPAMAGNNNPHKDLKPENSRVEKNEKKHDDIKHDDHQKDLRPKK